MTHCIPARIPLFLLAFLATCLVPDLLPARIKLITLPVRQRVEVQLDHPGATLVEEERQVPLVAGGNQVDFSWANTRIDPGSIIFRVLPPAEGPGTGARVISVSYPPGENALVWQVSAERSGPARVRISYLIGNLTKSFHYRAIASRDERTLELSQYLRVRNLAGESFDATGIHAGYGREFLKPIGLNETREMLLDRSASVPVRKTYTADLARHGYLDAGEKKLLVPMHYVISNTQASGLGQAPLEYGKVRIFQRDSAGTTAFLGEDWGAFTPVDDEMRLYLGVARDIVVRRTIARNQPVQKVGNLFDLELTLRYEIENFKDSAAQLDLAEDLRAVRDQLLGAKSRPVEWEILPETTFPGGLDRRRSTHERVVFHAPLPARSGEGKAEKIVHEIHVIIRNEW